MLNDVFRRFPMNGKVTVTQDIAAFGHDNVYAIRSLVESFDDFNEANDPS